MIAGLGAEGRAALGNLLLKAFSLPIERLCGLILVVVSAPLLGDESFGRFQFAATVTTMLAVGTDLGLAIWTTRALARRQGDVAAIVGTGLRVKAFATIPYAAVVAAAALAVGPGETRVALGLLAVAAIVTSFIDQLTAVLRGQERFADETRLNLARALLATGAALLGLFVGRSLATLAAGGAAGTVVAGGYGAWIVSVRHGLPTPFSRRVFDRALARVAVREALPLWLAGLLSMLYFKGDVVLLRLLSDDAELGAYSAAFRIFEGTMLLPAVVLAATFPPLARAHGRRDTGQQRRWERSIAAALAVAGAVVGLALALGSAGVVRLAFGPEFARATPSLLVLALAVPLLYLNFGLTHFLIARDLGRKNLLFAGLMLLVNLAANLVLIPKHGGPGAAWATVITEAALTALCLVTLGRSGQSTFDGRQ